jgi:hypothetical protein
MQEWELNAAAKRKRNFSVHEHNRTRPHTQSNQSSTGLQPSLSSGTDSKTRFCVMQPGEKSEKGKGKKGKMNP